MFIVGESPICLFLTNISLVCFCQINYLLIFVEFLYVCFIFCAHLTSFFILCTLIRKHSSCLVFCQISYLCLFCVCVSISYLLVCRWTRPEASWPAAETFPGYLYLIYDHRSDYTVLNICTYMYIEVDCKHWKWKKMDFCRACKV